MPRATYNLQEPNGRKFRVVGSGLTRAAAIAEANAKLALTVGTIIDSSVSDLLTGPETGTANGGASYSDAELTLKNGAKFVTLHVENISNEYGDTTTGAVDITNADIIAFATAYRDGAGNGGYAIDSGKFVR